MSKSEIQSWISSNTSGDPENGDSSAKENWRRDRVLTEWPRSIDVAGAKLLTNKTKVRISFLKDEMLSLARHGDMSLSQILDVFKLLTQTYPRYVDTASRNAVEVVGMELVRRDEVRGTPDGPPNENKLGVSEQILGWLANEVGQISKRGSSSSYASSDIFVLLSWSCGLYSVCLETNAAFISTHSYRVLVETLATLLDLLLNDGTRAKSSLQKGALVRMRRALRSAPANLTVLISTLISQANSSQTPLTFIPFLGVAVDVTISLKNVKDQSLTRLSPKAIDGILALYSSSILMSKAPVSSYTLTALQDFIATFVSTDDFTNIILPAMEKATLRSPEYSLNVISSFFHAYSHPLDDAAFLRILTPTLTNAKSTNPLTRTNAISVFKIVMKKNSTESNLALAVHDLLTLPKTGKTAGPDHRIALYSMLSALTPASSISASVVQITIPLLSKETNDSATSVLAAAIVPHIVFLIHSDTTITHFPTETSTLIAKEMTNSKPSTRRAFCSLVGQAFWECGNLTSPSSLALANTVLSSFDVNLKNVSTNPLGSGGGPLEGYIALAVILGPFSRSGKFDDFIGRNVTIQALGIGGSSTKPSFLVWDKVYQKVTDFEDEEWLLKATEVVLTYTQNELVKNQQLRTQLGLVFLHLAVEGQSPEIRRSVHVALEAATARFPQLVNRIAKEAMTALLTQRITKPSPSKVTTASTEEPVKPWNRHGRLAAFLLSCVAFKDDVNLATREEMVAELVVLSHHDLVSEPARQTWIDICQKARTDPHDLVDRNLGKLFKIILTASSAVVDSKSANVGFADASYNAVRTLTFVSPATVLPRVVDQLREDLGPALLNNLTQADFGVWATPEGATYVDVLSSKKSITLDTKGKDAEIARWEAEVKKSLASKRAASSTAILTKQEQVLVQAQLDKEAKIRQQVNLVKANIKRGLHFVHSLVAADVSEFQLYISLVGGLLLEGALSAKGSLIVGNSGFETYLELSKCSSERLDTFRKWIGIATLRSLKVESVPQELQAEPLNLLITRVLHRLRFLSEQAPFDAATFSYAFPLLSQVITQGGISVDIEDDPLEQVALALDIVKFHCGEFSDPAFPRAKTAENLIHIIRQQPKLTKDASSALVDLGGAIYATATRQETDVLLQGTLLQEVYVRNSVLQALQPFDLTDLDWSPELWLAQHDDDEQNARLATHVWDDNGLDVPEAFLEHMLDFLGHDHAYVRSSSAAAIGEAVKYHPQSLHATLHALQELYRDKAKILAPEFDEYGMVISQSLDRTDPWPARLSIARAFELLAPSFFDSEVEPFFLFLIKDDALGDRIAEVRRGMLTAGTAIIDLHGSVRLAALITMFEEHLAASSPTTETADHVQEGVVILFGRVARHLDPADARLPTIVNRLVEALKTPSEQVQIAVSDCLAPLVKVIGANLTQLAGQLQDDLFNAPKYASRRGAAYGLAGVVKGRGISGIKEFDVISRLRTAAEDKKRYEARQGAMFAFETLSSTLGRLFEPYVTHILPVLLSCFGDSISDVREATQDAARVIMGNMSGYGVKLILPSLLEGLDEKQWRTKKGSIELLGMMAYCSPRQLSLSLPIVIPRLTGVLTDSHSQVRAAANKSLKQFGEVISNPEIQSLVPILLKALVDPGKTPIALTSLLKTSFMHFIDHSSLALVVPIVERGLRERGADTKKKAAQIVGNLASLTDSKDFVPYLSGLLPLVHTVLVDPVPEARATAAKALGTLVERLGEVHFPDLVPGLLRTLKADTSGVDRQGAAQGLSEVLSGLGMERLEGLLPDIIANAQSPRSTVREGFMSLLVFLPATFGTRFQPHLPKIITPILGGLADSEEYVRDAAMRAGRMVVTNYSSKAIDLLLPELENGMFDGGWRIRQSSITLMGELLFKVSGISGKAEIEEDDVVVEVTETSRRALLEVLGMERRNRILSALYLVRQDGVSVVRQSSIHIWKALVQNTPRTVREILPELISQIIVLISGSEFEQQETASRTTAELCRKFGEKILGEIVPILQEKSVSPVARRREGVCLTLCEVMENTTDTQREGYGDDIITMVRTSLVDDEAEVRSAAAKAFDALQEHMGAKAIDQTIPTLLEALRQPGKGSGTALHALREVMSVRASTVFPILIPTLIATPMTVFNARALSSLVTVAGNALSKRLTVILGALAKVLEDGGLDEELEGAISEALRALLASIDDLEGLNTLMLLLLGWAKHDSPKRRVSACNFFSTFCEETELDSSLYRIDWIRQLVSLLEDSEIPVHTAAWRALDVFVKSIPKDELEPLVVPLRRTIEGTGAPGAYVPGFSLPKGVSPTVPIIIAGLTTGSNEQREQAAYAIGDLVERTEEDAIKPFVVPFTGPLIRVATQATTYPPAVKTAILSALTTMLERIPAFVKPFFPQLQRTFVKSASDPASVIVRNKAAGALGVLMKSQPRVDPVITELITGARGSEEGIASSLVLALANVIRSAGSNVGDKARDACFELVSDAFRDNPEEHYIQSIAALVASLARYPDLVRPIVEAHLVAGTTQTVLSSHTILAVLSEDQGDGPNLFQQLSLLRSVAQKVRESIANDKPSIGRPAREARDLLKQLDDDSLQGFF